LDDLVLAGVGDAELESRLASVRGDDGAIAEEDFGRRARKPGEEQAGAEGQSEQPDERFDRYDDVRSKPDRADRAVADGRQRVDAEEEGLQEVASDSPAFGDRQPPLAAEHVG